MNDKYLTVTALTRYLKRKIDTDPHLRDIWLRGEISNFKHHSRGHMYMTIKDEHAKIQAVMFAGNNRFLKFRPENGMSVLIRGEVSIYEAHGQYQLYIHEMEPDGIGSLYLAFEQLKDKLQKKGYFDPKYKKPLPLYPKHIGVITSPTGAAVRDIITTIERRYPIVKVTVLPVFVQGPNAAPSIVRAIEKANEMDFDVLIVGRGGGSIEELWSFNEEPVADAIFRSNIPIISAVGHETDVTISDYVADLRAPTPTGAAELAVPSQLEIREKIIHFVQRLNKQMQREITDATKRLHSLQDAYAFRYPFQVMNQKEQELDRFVERLERSFSHLLNSKMDEYRNVFQRLQVMKPSRQMQMARETLRENEKRLTVSMERLVERNTKELAYRIDRLTLLNPLEIMKRGFALPYTENGNIIRSVRQVEPTDHISVQVADGTISCEILEVKEEEEIGK